MPRRGSVVIEGMTGSEVVSGKAGDDFRLPSNLCVEFDDGGTWFSAMAISSAFYRKHHWTPAKAFGCINCKEIIVVNDHGNATKFGFTRVDEYERQVVNLIKDELWVGGM